MKEERSGSRSLLSPEVRLRLEREQRVLLPEVDRLLVDVGRAPPHRVRRRLTRLRRRLALYQQLVAGLLELVEEDPPA